MWNTRNKGPLLSNLSCLLVKWSAIFCFLTKHFFEMSVMTTTCIVGSGKCISILMTSGVSLLGKHKKSLHMSVQRKCNVLCDNSGWNFPRLEGFFVASVAFLYSLKWDTDWLASRHFVLMPLMVIFHIHVLPKDWSHFVHIQSTINLQCALKSLYYYCTCL